MNKLFMLLVVFGLTIFHAHGQDETITLKGLVLDKESNEPVEFASVGLLKSNISTVTNLSGEFTLTMTRDQVQDSVIISSIGYELASTLINKFITKDQLTIYLNQSKQVLDAVTVMDSLTADEIMKLALDRLEINHTGMPVSMDVFYRERQLIDDQYVSLVEAAMTVYDEYNPKRRYSPLTTKIRLDKLRRSLNHDHPYNDWWHQENLMMHAWFTNPIPYAEKNLKKNLNRDYYKRLPSTMVMGKEAYVVTTTHNRYYKGYWNTTFYIQAKTYAIVRAEQLYNEDIDGLQTWELEGDTITLNVHFKQRKAIVDFKKVNDKYLPSFVTFDANQDYYHEGKKLANFRIIQDIIINDFNYENPSIIERNESSKRSQSLRDQEYTYDEGFWKNYNVIKETPLETQLIRDLENKISLDSQFESQVTKKNK